MLKENSFDIELIVIHDKNTYKTSLHPVENSNNGCNHFDNIESVAAYMGKEITKQIKKTLLDRTRY